MTCALMFAVMAGVLDVAANVASAKSNGFSKRYWGIASILFVLAAFGLLGEAVKQMNLAIAYATLGATGIIGTAILGRLVFGQQLKPISWIGFITIIVAVFVLHLSDHPPIKKSSETVRHIFMDERIVLGQPTTGSSEPSLPMKRSKP